MSFTITTGANRVRGSLPVFIIAQIVDLSTLCCAVSARFQKNRASPNMDREIDHETVGMCQDWRVHTAIALWSGWGANHASPPTIG